MPLEQLGIYPSKVLLDLVMADSAAYMDWERKECYFDTEEFVGLLKSVQELNLSGPGAEDIYDQIYWAGEFLRGDVLSGKWSLSDADDFVMGMDCLEGYGEMAGWPTASGEPHYRIEPVMSFGINGKARCEEGAWAFLEYALTVDFMDWEGASYGGFSCNRERFEDSLESGPLSKIVIDEKHSLTWYHRFTGERMENIPYPELTKEGREALLFIADHMYCDDVYSLHAEYLKIIDEEAQSYFSGDKSAEEVAKLIQRRVSLYLQE